MKYAYLDNTPSQILHVVNDVKTAKEYACGKVVEVEMEDKFGFPVVDGDEYFYYHATQECFKGGNKQSSDSVKVKVPQEIADIVAQLI